MKITRHTAPDMRQAMRLIREQLGPDAVILSSKRTAHGVEITAAMDFDADAVAAAAEPVPPPAPPAPQQYFHDVAPRLSFTDAAPTMFAPERRPTRPVAIPAPLPKPAAAPAAQAAQTRAAAARHVPAAVHTPVAAAARKAPVALAAPAPAPAPTPAPAPAPAPAAIPVLAAAPAAESSAMETELKSLRRMLETQLATLAWKDLEQRAPVHTEMLRELTQMGLDPEFATKVAEQIPPYTDLLQARRLSIAGLAQRILVTGDNWLDNGGRIALVGPTGVGKSTTLAKLAVRWALRHGNRDLVLVGADTARLGAQEQIRSLGQLLGVPVHTPESTAELPALLSRLERFRCVLIDTAGQSQRDTQLTERLHTIATCHPNLMTTLVLSASTQAGAVAETVRRFAPARPSSVVLTKLDEAVSLGGLLSVLMRAQLPVAYVSEGQRVPEDLRPARSLELVSSAVTLAQMAGATADEDLLKRRFGDIAHAFAS